MSRPEDYEETLKVEAVKGLVISIGGAVGLMKHNVPFSRLNLILDADLSDPGIRSNLEVLASFSSRAISEPLLVSPRVRERPLSPASARKWLVDTGRVRLGGEELTLSEDDKTVHISIAALAIANAQEPQLLTDVYATLSSSPSPLHPDMIADLSCQISEAYHDK